MEKVAFNTPTMQVDNDLVSNLTVEGPLFEASWSDFMYNLEKLQSLRNADQNTIINIDSQEQDGVQVRLPSTYTRFLGWPC